jgi:hypothetical protein
VVEAVSVVASVAAGSVEVLLFVLSPEPLHAAKMITKRKKIEVRMVVLFITIKFIFVCNITISIYKVYMTSIIKLKNLRELHHISYQMWHYFSQIKNSFLPWGIWRKSNSKH